MFARLQFWSLACLVLTLRSLEAGERDVVTYAGGPGHDRFQCVARLSDGTILIGGGSEQIKWLPPNVKPVELQGCDFPSGASGKTAFLLHLSADLQQMLTVVTLPADRASEVSAIRFTSRAGEPTGTLFISGRIKGDEAKKIKPGYFLGRLDGNFLDRVPTKFVWTRAIWGEGPIGEDQPWDVGSDGKVIFAEGASHGYDWVAIKRLTPSGKIDVVEDWRLHVYEQEGKRKEWFGSPASKCPHGKPIESAIVLKVWGRGDFRSWTQAEYESKTSDGNGGEKQGAWPYDAFFAGPFNPQEPNASPKGRGYTGYGWPATPCGNVGAIAIDRRDNHVYVGGNNKSSLPKGPDFEPYVIAFTENGKKKWWMRLYREVPPKPGQAITDDQDGRLSTPDQYVDALAIDDTDPRGGALVVLARAHGNNVVNLWPGNKIVDKQNPGTSFQPYFTGSNGNIHYQWLGRLGLAEGEMRHATFIGELNESAKTGKQSWDDPNLDSWPRFDSGWPDLNTTRCRSTLRVDEAGNCYVVGTGRRPVTTKNAYMKMPKPGEAESRWCDFVRVYRRDLTGVHYSSILTGAWNWNAKGGGSGVSLQGVVPVADGLIAVGYGTIDAKTGELGPHEMPLSNRPAWGAKERDGESGVAAKLSFVKE